MVQFVGPVVPVEADDKPLSTALREINEGLLIMEEAPDAE